MGKKSQQFKSLPWWVKLGVLVFAVAVGLVVWAVALGVQSDAQKQEAIDGCNKALAVKGAAAIGSPYAHEFPGGWAVSGQALARGQQVGFDCSEDSPGQWSVDLLP